jgi:cyclopropane-fatty-acyl-phospholipid synthase
MAKLNLVAAATGAVERWSLPDPIARLGIALLVDRTSRSLGRGDPDSEGRFAKSMSAWPIAFHPDAANAQHYELPAEFFALVLGPRRKYSCCLYEEGDSLAAAEERALRDTVDHADIRNGDRILELGCGWGSLSLWLAEHFPDSSILAVSNSQGQRAFIEGEAARRGLRALRVVTADMNDFDPGERFDRIVSVEMWEHMSNWAALLARVRGWLEPHGKLFLHVFSHRTMPYRFDHADKSDWIAQHFFTGGIMPSHGLIRHLDAPMSVAAEWRWNGQHYRRTAEDWLINYDANAAAIDPILREVYGPDAALWKRRWRLFFLATAGLFGARAGTEWGISHYLLSPR